MWPWKTKAIDRIPVSPATVRWDHEFLISRLDQEIGDALTDFMLVVVKTPTGQYVSVALSRVGRC